MLLEEKDIKGLRAAIAALKAKVPGKGNPDTLCRNYLEGMEQDARTMSEILANVGAKPYVGR